MTADAFNWEPVESVLGDMGVREMILEQWEELAGNRGIPLDPDFGRMRLLEEAGMFKIWGARRDGLLVGFIEFSIIAPLHHRKTLYAFDGGHFVHPEFRSPFLWLAMWRSALAALRDIGVQMVVAHDNPRRPLDIAFERLGFTPGGRMYQRET